MVPGARQPGRHRNRQPRGERRERARLCQRRFLGHAARHRRKGRPLRHRAEARRGGDLLGHRQPRRPRVRRELHHVAQRQVFERLRHASPADGLPRAELPSPARARDRARAAASARHRQHPRLGLRLRGQGGLPRRGGGLREHGTLRAQQFGDRAAALRQGHVRQPEQAGQGFRRRAGGGDGRG